MAEDETLQTTEAEATGVALRRAADQPQEHITRRVTTPAGDRWSLDNDDEFFASYAGARSAVYVLAVTKLATPQRVLDIRLDDGPAYIETDVTITLSSRGALERVMQAFRDDEVTAFRSPPPEPPPPPPRVFIGHGHSEQWRRLKDHLHEQHGYDVEAYETGARAGHTIRDILERMMSASAFAVLVMTAEDQQAAHTMRARQNVVHEAGLFQGRLGFERAIVAVEDGVEPFSNLQGIDQLRFAQGNIREIYGDVLATLRREFRTP